MKLKIKCIYKDKVEPTLLKEIETSNNQDKKNLISEILTVVDEILEPEGEIEGLFLSRQ